MGDFFNAIISPLVWVTSVILAGFHHALSTIMPSDGGWTWVLSIIGLTVAVRAALIPLFVKQIKSSRNMQLLQPRVRELQKKYGHDREKLAQETMALYRESGTNPFASCMPLLLQMPIFLALFRLISNASSGKTTNVGVLSPSQIEDLSNATIFGAHISERFTGSGVSINVQILAIVLVIAMTATTFTTQKQLMSKNMPADALKGPYASQQKILLYVLPLVFAVGGIAFPIGLLIYWTTSNLWTMAQQFYVIRSNPAPGTPAFEAKEKRVAAKAARKGLPTAAVVEEIEAPAEEQKRPSTRQQPKNQPRSQRKKQGGPGGSGGGSGGKKK